jgi:glutamate--cysteine ligase
MTYAERDQLCDVVPRQGFAARAGAHTVGELARELVAIARDGLSRVAPDARSLIDPVEAIATSGRTHADKVIDAWRAHAGDGPALVRALAHPGLA